MSSVWRMVAVLAGVCILSALGLAFVHDLTRGPIEEAKRKELLDALQVVMPQFDNAPDQDKEELAGRTFYRGKKGSETTGFAFAAVSNEGYGGRIEALVGVRPSGEIEGVAILSHAETPGLGAKFTEPKFLSQFKDKTLEGVKWGVEKDGGDFDAITGATITPRATVKAIKEGLESFAASGIAQSPDGPN